MAKNRFLLALAAIVFIFSSTPLLAQKCHLEIDEKDPFSGEYKRMYKHMFATSSPLTYWEIQFDQKGSAYSMTLGAFLKGRNFISAAEGTILFMKLEDNTVMEFKVDKEVPPVFTSTYGDKTRWDLKFNLTEAQMKQFSASPLSTLKVTIGKNEIYGPEIAGKAANKIMTGAACMLLKD